MKLKADGRYIIVHKQLDNEGYYQLDLKDKLGIVRANLVCEDNAFVLVAESISKMIVAGISQVVKVNVTERVQVMAEYTLGEYVDFRVWTTASSLYVALKPADAKLKDKVDCLSLKGLQRVYLMTSNDRDTLSDNEFDLRFMPSLDQNGPASDLHTQANYLTHQETAKLKGLVPYIGR
jgi:hypothetical protein